MDLITNRTMEITHLGMNGLMDRQHAIASNIANVNTPGYQRKEVAFERQENAVFYYPLFDGETNYYSHVPVAPLWGMGKYVVDGIMYDDLGVCFDPEKAADDAYNDALEIISVMQSEGHVLTGYGWDEFTGYVFYDDRYEVDSVFHHNP